MILNHIMKYHFKRMLQHNTFDTQRLLNICLKKYNLKNHKREKKIKENNMSIVTATKKNPCMVLIAIKCYFKTQYSHFLQKWPVFNSHHDTFTVTSNTHYTKSSVKMAALPVSTHKYLSTKGLHIYVLHCYI